MAATAIRGVAIVEIDSPHVAINVSNQRGRHVRKTFGIRKVGLVNTRVVFAIVYNAV